MKKIVCFVMFCVFVAQAQAQSCLELQVGVNFATSEVADAQVEADNATYYYGMCNWQVNTLQQEYNQLLSEYHTYLDYVNTWYQGNQGYQLQNNYIERLTLLQTAIQLAQERTSEAEVDMMVAEYTLADAQRYLAERQAAYDAAGCGSQYPYPY